MDNLQFQNLNGSRFDYKVKDFTTFSVDINEWDNLKKKWVAYKTSDIQLEFFMLDPYYRINLQHNGNGTYYTSF